MRESLIPEHMEVGGVKGNRTGVKEPKEKG